MPTENIKIKTLKTYFRPKENWFKELLYKLHILKPKFQEFINIVNLGEKTFIVKESK